jgi:hypothetical protein
VEDSSFLEMAYAFRNARLIGTKVELLQDNHISRSKSIRSMNPSFVNPGLMGELNPLTRAFRQTGGASLNSAKGQGFSVAVQSGRAEGKRGTGQPAQGPETP